MIEIVNEPRPADKGEKPPRNIRQIGNISENHIVYMEDYVYRFLHKKDRKMGRCTFVFLGEILRTGDRHQIYMKGALELPDISYGGGMPVFSDDMWDEIYRQSRQYFPQWSIVGWGMQTVGPKQEMEKEIKKICNRHFPGNHGNVYLFDGYGEWEQMYLDIEGQMVPEDGYCIYYEKNTPMGSYLSTYHTRQEQELLETSGGNWDGFLVHDEAKYERENRQDAEAMARYRAYMNGQQQRIHSRRSKVAVSIAMVVMLLLSGILIQNYARLSDMESSVEALSDQKEASEAQEDVIKETISKKASELAQTTTEENPYLAQGYYIVEQGDKLTDISKKVYGNDTMVQAICEKNHIEDIDLIKAGDKLLLP